MEPIMPDVTLYRASIAEAWDVIAQAITGLRTPMTPSAILPWEWVLDDATAVQIDEVAGTMSIRVQVPAGDDRVVTCPLPAPTWESLMAETRSMGWSRTPMPWRTAGQYVQWDSESPWKTRQQIIDQVWVARGEVEREFRGSWYAYQAYPAVDGGGDPVTLVHYIGFWLDAVFVPVGGIPVAPTVPENMRLCTVMSTRTNLGYGTPAPYWDDLDSDGTTLQSQEWCRKIACVGGMDLPAIGDFLSLESRSEDGRWVRAAVRGGPMTLDTTDERRRLAELIGDIRMLAVRGEAIAGGEDGAR